MNIPTGKWRIRRYRFPGYGFINSVKGMQIWSPAGRNQGWPTMTLEEALQYIDDIRKVWVW